MFVQMEKEAENMSLTVNETKTKYMHLTRKDTRDRGDQNVTMNDKNFEMSRLSND